MLLSSSAVCYVYFVALCLALQLSTLYVRTADLRNCKRD